MEDVRKFAAAQKISEQGGLQVGLEQKAIQLKDTHAEIHDKL